jgi:hypothetical protein
MARSTPIDYDCPMAINGTDSEVKVVEVRLEPTGARDPSAVPITVSAP